MADDIEITVEESREILSDATTFALAIAAEAVSSCGRHDRSLSEKLFDRHAYRDHAMDCMGTDVGAFDKVRLLIDRWIELLCSG